MNLYGFIGNDGVNRWDYLGLCCCKDIAEQKEKLEERFDEAVSRLRSGGVKCEGKNNWSCKNISYAMLAALEPIPDCWKCSVERRKKQYGVISWFDPRDHQVVSCYSTPTEDGCEVERIVFDAWYDNSDSISEEEFQEEWPWPLEPENPLVGHNESDLNDAQRDALERTRMNEIDSVANSPENGR